MNHLTEQIQEDYSYIDKIFELKHKNPSAYKVLKETIVNTLKQFDNDFRFDYDDKKLLKTMKDIHKYFWGNVLIKIEKEFSDLIYYKKIKKFQVPDFNSQMMSEITFQIIKELTEEEQEKVKDEIILKISKINSEIIDTGFYLEKLIL
jgi:hypothetical protein